MTTSSASWIAAVRARESGRADRLFDDPFARELAGERGFAMMAASERATGGENSFIPVRVRWFDDLVRSTVPRVRQVVLLGAGLDTRPFRLTLPADLDWYEVDRQEVLTGKQAVLAGHAPTCRRRVVVGDVTDGFGLALRDNGFDRSAPTLWLAEGLFFYLSEQLIVQLLRDAASLSGPASVFAADVTGTIALDSPAMHRYRTWCADNGRPPPFGADDPEALFTAGGWRIDHLTAPGAPDANYGRLRSQPAGLLPGRTHLVTATHG